jgi:hypothetical protein
MPRGARMSPHSQSGNWCSAHICVLEARSSRDHIDVKVSLHFRTRRANGSRIKVSQNDGFIMRAVDRYKTK